MAIDLAIYEGANGTWLGRTFRPANRSLAPLCVAESTARPRSARVWGGAMFPHGDRHFRAIAIVGPAVPPARAQTATGPTHARYGGVPSGVVKGSRVRTTDRIEAFLAALWAKVKSVVPGLYVTSGDRPPEDQARAMLAKAVRKDNGSTDPDDDLLQLYSASVRPQIRLLLASGRNLATWTTLISEWEAQGIRLSDHQSGSAVDIDDQFAGTAFTIAQVKAIEAAARALGASPLLESIGKKGGHIHIEDLPASGTWSEEQAEAPTRPLTPVAIRRPSPGQVLFLATLGPGEAAWLESQWLGLETHPGDETDPDTYDLMWAHAAGFTEMCLKKDLVLPPNSTVVLDTTPADGATLHMSVWPTT